jgi:N-acylneuraminate cytidylyltransferase
VNIIDAIVPARQGSSAVKDKNILPYQDKPLLLWSIEQALSCPSIDRTFISTDSPVYEELSISSGAISLGLRPNEISSAYSRDIGYLQHHLTSLQRHSMKEPRLIVILRPTSPKRDISELDRAIQFFISNYEHYDAIRSVSPAEQNPFKCWIHIDGSPLVKPLVGSFDDDYVNSPRQLLPKAYWQNGCFDILKPSIIRTGSHLGTRVYPWIQLSRGVDIDTLADFQ